MSVQKGISDEVSTILNEQLVTDETCTSILTTSCMKQYIYINNKAC